VLWGNCQSVWLPHGQPLHTLNPHTPRPLSPHLHTPAHPQPSQELGAPITELFSEFSAEPVGAASLAQVYRARIRATGVEVAVKVQRPGALSTISKDLYVMRRAVGVYERLIKRFTAQTTDYQSLLSTFAEGEGFGTRCAVKFRSNSDQTRVKCASA